MFFRNKRKTYDEVEAVLDSLLSKGSLPLPNITDETRISKLAHKARRVAEMLTSETEQHKGEKEAIQSFISDMSHQMKTPLAAIAMYTELLVEGGLSEEEQRDFLSRMKISTEKLQWMTESLIKMSRLESGAIALNPANSGIKQTISEAITGILAAADKRGISIAVSDFDDVPLYHDKKWTVEALGNILENAVKYAIPDSEITVSLEPSHQYSKIAIRNYGVGILKSDRHLIFKRFYRGQNVKDKEGVGLGLYLVTVIMEKQGGYIMVDSIPRMHGRAGCEASDQAGQSATFSLFLQNCKK